MGLNPAAGPLVLLLAELKPAAAERLASLELEQSDASSFTNWSTFTNTFLCGIDATGRADVNVFQRTEAEIGLGFLFILHATFVQKFKTGSAVAAAAVANGGGLGRENVSDAGRNACAVAQGTEPATTFSNWDGINRIGTD